MCSIRQYRESCSHNQHIVLQHLASKQNSPSHFIRFNPFSCRTDLVVSVRDVVQVRSAQASYNPDLKVTDSPQSQSSADTATVLSPPNFALAPDLRDLFYDSGRRTTSPSPHSLPRLSSPRPRGRMYYCWACYCRGRRCGGRRTRPIPVSILHT